jgi:hypothetical protein
MWHQRRNHRLDRKRAEPLLIHDIARKQHDQYLWMPRIVNSPAAPAVSNFEVANLAAS